jgi:hypothetical protein
LARGGHRSEYRLLAANATYEIDASLEQNPPEVSWLSFPEELLTRMEPTLVAHPHQLSQLGVVETVEQRETSELLGVHHTVAR